MVVLSELCEGSSSSSSTHGHIYDVFLSFRGPDTRPGFTAHLHKAFMEANISTFLDDEEIDIGEDLKPELESAIKASRASVIVLSKNYASSTWCLDELVLILEQRITSNHIVFPIFYHVEPTDVRKQQSSFGDAMAKHRRMIEAETNASKRSNWAQKMEGWNEALIKVAGLKGMDVNGSKVSEFLEEIVKDIYSKLRISSRSPQPQLFGMDYSINFVTSWLKDVSPHTTKVLTILGMGGIGKTSLAKYVYGLHSHEFDTSSFIEDISRRCNEKSNGLLDVQKELYTSMKKNVLAQKKVFVVLDDIDSLDQLDALLGSKGFYPGSKVIITTRDTWLTKSCALFKTNVKPKHEEHEIQVLHNTKSRQLLCYHAFMSNHPRAGYEEVLEKLVKYCEGHPMALTVLGRSLHNRGVSYWEGCIEGLKKENGSPVNNVLKMSYDSLPSKNNKDLFKHIACFFVGMDKDVFVTILEACDIETRAGITNLIDRCLLSIGRDKELMMHQLVQEMGRFIVREESPDKPWERSRLWSHDSFKVLKQKKGTENVVGLALDMRMLEKEKLRGSCELETDAFIKMDSLMPATTQLCANQWLLQELFTTIKMVVYPQRPRKRHKLDGSCLKDKMFLGSLKILNLSFSQQLHSVGGFDQFPALERLILRSCSGLVEVCESIEKCVELVFVDMSYCNKLENLPRIIGALKKVKTLLLDGCDPGESQIKFGGMDSPENLKANNIGINTKASSSSAIMEAIPMDSKFFEISLPRSVVKLSLEYNNLSTESFPMDFSCLSMLEDLCLDGNPIVSLPNCVRSLPRLESLSMTRCDMLISVEHPPPTLKALNVYSSNEKSLLKKIVFDPKMSPLEYLIRWENIAPSSFEFEGMIKIQPLAGVEEKVLCSLGWTELDFLKERCLGIELMLRGKEESEIQMYYEFGIFSIIYGGQEMPDWIRHRSKGPSISFTIPSSPNNYLTGLNFCFALMPSVVEFQDFPLIVISNITKNHTWIYDHYIDSVNVGGECVIMLSHWMFGMTNMEAGDRFTITITHYNHEPMVKECGACFVYDDGKMDEEDGLGYYKSWNHIFGKDLSGFQVTTGEYILNLWRFMSPGEISNLTEYKDLCKEGARYKGRYIFYVLPLSKVCVAIT